ncbi:MAG: hypothetical protein TYPL_2170 [Candidatus Tyloplasma litorale]|nr:MAG: hypothetical protein TYPL_2170 [Mycoplasmatales bacterium]
MKNILLVEIKDIKTIVTLVRFINENNYVLLFHKKFKSTSNSNEYNYLTILKIKKVLENEKLFNLIDKTYITFHSKINLIQIEKNQSKEKLERNNYDCKITKFTSYIKNGEFLYESINKKYLNEIFQYFEFYEFKNIEFISSLDAIQNSIRKHALEDNQIYLSISLEEKFTQLTMIENGKIFNVVRLEFGLNKIYEYISEKMNIPIENSKNLFKTFGIVSFQDMIDNKVLHLVKDEFGFNKIFTKGDLSIYIKEKLNNLFLNINKKINDYKLDKNRLTLIFNGEIKALIGFQKYTLKFFNELNINEFDSKLIGLKADTEFITMGLILEIQKNIHNIQIKTKSNLSYTLKINIFNKLFRMYN